MSHPALIRTARSSGNIRPSLESMPDNGKGPPVYTLHYVQWGEGGRGGIGRGVVFCYGLDKEKGHILYTNIETCTMRETGGKMKQERKREREWAAFIK